MYTNPMSQPLQKTLITNPWPPVSRVSRVAEFASERCYWFGVGRLVTYVIYSKPSEPPGPFIFVEFSEGVGVAKAASNYYLL